MQTPVQIAFKNVVPSEGIRALNEDKAGHLDTFHDGITNCHVYVRAPHQSRRKDNLHDVTIQILVPGTEPVVRRDQNGVAEHKPLRVAIRDAFAAMAIEMKRWKDSLKDDMNNPDGKLRGKEGDIGPRASIVRSSSAMACDPAANRSRR